MDSELKNKKLYITVIFAAAAALTVFTFFLNIGIGSVNIPLRDVAKILIQGDTKGVTNSAIVWKIRMPRTIAVLLGGASIAIAGLLLQIFFRNPIVGPFVLGISSGATLMVGIVILGSALLPIAINTKSPYVIFFAAFIGSIGVMLLVLYVSGRVKSIISLLIIGLMVGYLCSALTSILIVFADDANVKGFNLWQMGSFAGFTWDSVKVLTMVSIPLLLMSNLLSKPLNALILGENYAQSLGINIKRTRFFIIFISSLLSGVVTAFAGPVSFIGLAVPHLSRILLRTSDNKILFPAAILLGAVLTGLCDLLARMIFMPSEIPLSAVTALVGAPMVIAMMLRRQKHAA